MSARGSRPALLVVGLCWLAVLFDGLDMFIYGSVLPHLLETRTFGLTADQAGDLGSYATSGMLVGALVAGTIADRIGRKKLMVSCVILFSLASGLCALADSVTVFGLGRTLAGVGLGGLLPTAISMVSDYAPRGRGAIVIGLLMTAHHAGGILSAYVAKWLIDPVGRRAAFWVCVLPLLFAPVLAKFLPESLSFLVAKGRGEEARALAERYDVEVPAVRTGGAGDPWTNLANLLRGNERIQTLLHWVASFGGLLLVYGVATWLPTLMRAEGYELGSALSFVVVFNLGGIVGMLVAGRAADRVTAPRISGMGRFGAVFGPWLGGRLLASGNGDWGFTAFAIAGLSSMVFIGIAALRSPKHTATDSERELVGAH
ncbi:MFS transporter [Streptomyces sp. SAI-144]|uniref:MFS transporter n=1 Tax=Streptomyces sp. SAI-144 TaxID=2940544 RepID=UPI002476E5C0|nr:MFS transporter [Streptomyces sp. SAI-144]